MVKISDKYTMNLTNSRFWFTEQEKVIDLLLEGYTLNEIKEKNKEDNIFDAASERRSLKIMRHIAARLKPLGTDYIALFSKENVPGKKLLVLVSLMVKDRLFFEFMYQVFRKKIMMGDLEISACDFSIFWTHMASQNEKIAGYSQGVIENLENAIRSILFNAGLLSEGQTDRKIIIPFVDDSIHKWLANNELIPIYKALTGEA